MIVADDTGIVPAEFAEAVVLFRLQGHQNESGHSAVQTGAVNVDAKVADHALLFHAAHPLGNGGGGQAHLVADTFECRPAVGLQNV